MTIHNDTLTRQWRILRLIPRYPRKRTAMEIYQALRRDGQTVSKRTIERDLVALSALFPIVADESEKPFGWSWAKGAPTIDIPAMTDAEAVTFKLLEQYLGHLLPPSYREKLEPYFATAGQRLLAAHGTRVARTFVDKIRIVQPLRSLIPRDSPQGIQDTVLEALLRERQLAITYMRKAAEAPEHLRVSPCAVVQYWGRMFLIGLRSDGASFEAFRLHRVRAAELLPDHARIPEGFDVDRYLFPKTYYEQSLQGVRYRGVCTREAGEVLIDRPIGLNQRVMFEPGGQARFEVTVPRKARDVLTEIEKREGAIDDMGLMFFNSEFWDEQLPVPPIGGLDV